MVAQRLLGKAWFSDKGGRHVECKTENRCASQCQKSGRGSQGQEIDQSSFQGYAHRARQAGGQSRERAPSPRLMPTENPQNPRPDDLPEDERTGNEPNPSGQAPVRKSPRP